MRTPYLTEYTAQRYNAINVRGIDWQFTFETWRAWWGEDIIHRGCRKGQLVQARKGDTGPYSPDNCFKLTAGQNVVDAHMGKTHSEEHRAKISASCLGKTHSEETRAKMSANRKGKPKSAEHCAKISAAKMGKPRSAETRAKISATKKARDKKRRGAV